MNYTYAVARAFALSDVEGVDGAPVHAIGYGDLVAVVSPIEAWDASRLETLEQVDALARAHHGVVELVAAQSATISLRLGTMHRDRAGVEAMLCREYEQLSANLDRLAGRVELGVKAYAPARPAAAAIQPTSGTDYLRQRRALRDRGDEAWQRAATAAEQLDAALATLAVDRRLHRPQPHHLSGVDGENVLNAAYLVEAAQVNGFTRRALDLASPDVRVQVTGPWAPYSFASDET